jgi:hypothetical protein
MAAAARTAETEQAYRREATARIAKLEQERAFASKTIFYSCNSQLRAVRPTFVADAFLRQAAGGTPKLRLNARLNAASDS